MSTSSPKQKTPRELNTYTFEAPANTHLGVARIQIVTALQKSGNDVLSRADVQIERNPDNVQEVILTLKLPPSGTGKQSAVALSAPEQARFEGIVSNTFPQAKRAFNNVIEFKKLN